MNHAEHPNTAQDFDEGRDVAVRPIEAGELITTDARKETDRELTTFLSAYQRAVEIYLMNADGTGQVRLTVHAAADTLPAWSPDGGRIAFTSTRSGDGDIYVMSANGGAVTRLTTHAKPDVEPAWSPDGSRLAFATSRDGGSNYEVYVMDRAERLRRG